MPTAEEAAKATTQGAALPPPELRGARVQHTELEGVDAVEAVGKGKKLTSDEAASALDWFLTDDPIEDDDGTKTLEINVGGTAIESEHWIEWKIRRVDVDELRRIQKISEGRARRDSTGDDGMEGNLRVIVAGTVEPDLMHAARERGIADPAMLVRLKFKKKSGLLPQIAGEIMALSGFDSADIREAAAGKD